jgi:ribonucleoside-diphosphate reductase alpha chain
MDNVVDEATYPLPEQEAEAKNKRRMGLGITGLANAGEALGFPYGSDRFIEFTEQVMTTLRDVAYQASIELAIEKGPFPLFDVERYGGEFFDTLPEYIQHGIRTYGIRNSHLLSVAPTGTISLSADNISSGIEPVFNHHYDRTIQTYEGPRVERVEDYGYRVFGVKGVTANELDVMDHVKVLTTASRYVDSACSKTCNVGDDVSWEKFKDVYMTAYDGGASGCTTFRAAGKRYGILNSSYDEDVAEEPEVKEDDWVDEGGACFIDPLTGQPTCS